MNYDALLSFAVFAEDLNFTRAAARLALSQPALHVKIRKLAEDVGRPLYRKQGRALLLTSEGTKLAAYAREVRDRGQAVLEELRGGPQSGPVVLAAGEGAFLYLLGPALRRFPKERWPLRLLTLRGPETLEAVAASRAHVGVVAATQRPEELESQALCKVGQRVIVPAGHRLARRRHVAPRDLHKEPLIVVPTGLPHRAMLEQALAADGARLSVAVEATGWELMLHFARCGMGLAVVNDFCPAPRGMVGVPLTGVPSVTYWLVRRRAMRTPGAEALWALLGEERGSRE